MTSYEQHCLNLLVGDSMRMLLWILEQGGKAAHISSVPVNFNSNHWMTYNRPEGEPLYKAQSVEGSGYRFTFEVTNAGMNFLREHGWTGGAENPPLDPGQYVPVEKKTLTSVWLLDRNRQVHEWKDLSRVPTHIVETLKDNDVAVIDGQLYAVSFEHLMGTEDDPTLSVQ